VEVKSKIEVLGKPYRTRVSEFSERLYFLLKGVERRWINIKNLKKR